MHTGVAAAAQMAVREARAAEVETKVLAERTAAGVEREAMVAAAEVGTWAVLAAVGIAAG